MVPQTAEINPVCCRSVDFRFFTYCKNLQLNFLVCRILFGEHRLLPKKIHFAHCSAVPVNLVVLVFISLVHFSPIFSIDSSRKCPSLTVHLKTKLTPTYTNIMIPSHKTPFILSKSMKSNRIPLTLSWCCWDWREAINWAISAFTLKQSRWDWPRVCREGRRFQFNYKWVRKTHKWKLIKAERFRNCQTPVRKDWKKSIRCRTGTN